MIRKHNAPPAFACDEPEFARPGQRLDVMVLGERRSAQVVDKAPYDPDKLRFAHGCLNRHPAPENRTAKPMPATKRGRAAGIGSLSSGGYGPETQRSLAFAFDEPEFDRPGKTLESMVLGERRSARVIDKVPYDPENRHPAPENRKAKAMPATKQGRAAGIGSLSSGGYDPKAQRSPASIEPDFARAGHTLAAMILGERKSTRVIDKTP